MICYKDKTFCPFYETCAKQSDCSRPLTQQVKAAAAKWWGSDAAPIALFREKPECHTSNKVSEAHFGDKKLYCKRCEKDIFIPHNQVGGFWHLSGWTNPHGIKFWGGYCSPCFRKLDQEKKEP